MRKFSLITLCKYHEVTPAKPVLQPVGLYEYHSAYHNTTPLIILYMLSEADMNSVETQSCTKYI